MSQPDIVLYTAKICPWAQRATLALEEVGAKWDREEIDLQNKPEWYASKVNPASKVPVIQIGKDQATSPKIPESWVIVELIADLFNSTHPLYPQDPIKKAEQRYFNERLLQLIHAPFMGAVATGDTTVVPKILEGVEEVQLLLKRNPGKFFDGDEFTAADIGVAPFVSRSFVFGKSGIEPAATLYQTIISDPKYAVFKKYVEDILERPSFKATFDEPYIVEKMKARFASLKK